MPLHAAKSHLLNNIGLVVSRSRLKVFDRIAIGYICRGQPINFRANHPRDAAPFSISMWAPSAHSQIAIPLVCYTRECRPLAVRCFRISMEHGASRYRAKSGLGAGLAAFFPRGVSRPVVDNPPERIASELH